VIDAEDLVLAQHFQDALVERTRRGEIVAERLLDDHPAPEFAVRATVVHQPGIAQLLDHVAEEALRRGEVEQHVALRAPLALDLSQAHGKAVEGRQVVEIAGVVAHLRAQPIPVLLVELAAGVADEALERGAQALLPRVIGHLAVIESDDREVVGEQPCAPHVVERRDDEPAGEVTGGAEDHDGARIGRMSPRGRALRLGWTHAWAPWVSIASGVAWTSAVAL